MRATDAHLRILYSALRRYNIPISDGDARALVDALLSVGPAVHMSRVDPESESTDNKVARLSRRANEIANP